MKQTFLHVLTNYILKKQKPLLLEKYIKENTASILL